MTRSTSLTRSELGELIGPVATEQLIQSFGGTEVYIPKTESVGGRRLAVLLGDDVYRCLRDVYSGSQLLIPNSGKQRLEGRNAAIWASYVASEGNPSGGVSRADALALRYGLTRRQIFNIIRKFKNV